MVALSPNSVNKSKISYCLRVIDEYLLEDYNKPKRNVNV